MDKSTLQDYDNWVGKSAHDVRESVSRISGGWLTIFPHSLPSKIHIVRNYFNVLPKRLKLLTKQQARVELQKIKFFERHREAIESVTGVVNKGIISDKAVMWAASKVPGMKFLPRTSKPSELMSGDASRLLRIDVKAVFALTGVVFHDQQNHPWYQMTPVGASYHINKGEGNRFDVVQGVLDIEMPFKLVSPDGNSGGSHEVIMKSGKFRPGETITPKIDFNPATRGSYNYGETITSGSTHHQRLDVNPHRKIPHYSNVNIPLSAHSTLRMRKFLPPFQFYQSIGV